MVTAVTLALAGPAATALLSHGTDQGGEPVRVFPEGRALGHVVAECGGVSPKDNDCHGNFPYEQCLVPNPDGGKDMLCLPDVKNTLGYTGTIRASLFGRNPTDPGQVVSVWWECRFVAGQTVTLGGVGVGHRCLPDSDAPMKCADGDCWWELASPFSYGGLASPMLRTGAPAGPWQVAVVR